MKKYSAYILACVLVVLSVLGNIDNTVLAADNSKVITIDMAVNMGISKSKNYRKVKSQIALKQIKYAAAVKSIRLKKKNMSTFRWSPLLNFKFPQKATLAEEFEFTFKPIQIQSEIDVLNHKLSDTLYESTEKVSNLYVEIYTYQEKIAYEEKQLQSLKDNLDKNSIKLMTGEAKQSDIDKINSSIKALENTMASDKRAFEKDKSDITDLIGLNVTSGYRFTNPYIEATISRSQLDSLITKTLDRSQSFYEAKMNTKLALTSVNTNYSLMNSQYGWKMGYISGYFTQAKNGNAIDADAFKTAYNNFLTEIDSPWTGKKKILFIRIPREWFKGSIDGVRYVEDDPYILYTNVLEYIEALDDQNSLEKEIRKEVENTFENLVTLRNTYDFSVEQMNTSKQEMTKAKLLNSAGELTFEEYDEIRQEYEELQISVMENLKLYSQQLYSFDRLTCGSVKELLNSTDNSLSEGAQGDSYIEETETGIYYNITNIVADNIFEVSLYTTEDCETDVTSFELWVDGTQIGAKTDIDKVIRHLTLDMDSAENVIIRLYDGDKFILDCKIDPQVYSDQLAIEVKKVEEAEEQKVLGTYSYTVNKNTGTVNFSVTPDKDLNAKYFKLVNSDGKAVYSDEPIAVENTLTYLSFIKNDLENLKVVFYDGNKKELKTGIIQSSGKQIIEK